MKTYTPAEVAEMTGSREKFIKRLALEHRVPCLRVQRGAVRFTEAQVDDIVTYLTQPPTSADGLVTARARRRSA